MDFVRSVVDSLAPLWIRAVDALPRVAAAHVPNGVAAGTEHVGIEPPDVFHTLRPQRLEDGEQDALHELLGALLVAQMAQAVREDSTGVFPANSALVEGRHGRE